MHFSFINIKCRPPIDIGIHLFTCSLVSLVHGTFTVGIWTNVNQFQHRKPFYFQWVSNELSANVYN